MGAATACIVQHSSHKAIPSMCRNRHKKFRINVNDIKVIHKKWNTRDNKILSKTKNNYDIKQHGKCIYIIKTFKQEQAKE